MNPGDCIIFGNGPEWMRKLKADGGVANINSPYYKKYKEWITLYPEKVHLSYRQFLEIKIGSWLSSIQHSYDMCTDIKRFSFPICEKLIANINSYDKKFRSRTASLVTKKIVPELYDI